MITKNRIIEVSPTLFLNSLPTEMHSEVSALFYDLKVDYIVLMIPKDGGKRQVIPVGRKSQYKEISEVSADLVDGMQARAFVDARKAFPDLSKRHSPSKRPSAAPTTKPANSSDPQIKALSRQSELLQKQVDELKGKLAEDQSKVMLKDQTINELKLHLEQNSISSEEDTINESVLVDRENSVLKSEEELINRLTFLMEKEAELEQFQEDLSYRERKLDEREGKERA